MRVPVSNTSLDRNDPQPRDGGAPNPGAPMRSMTSSSSSPPNPLQANVHMGGWVNDSLRLSNSIGSHIG
ncbi:hypothetical protein P154DRAFT_580233 [Amniculicola lignicola CBS 123094]|uniref:Uncharacterized protein n=1 Tax=Amniculicola lignicola CBS 123094 TaxID=1392246 RepID=A0A6A5W7R6_9PLEO|nr:hypothetical protein P154DRAFT_580233 [Amniculicola lignicola CBS 123094]